MVLPGLAANLLAHQTRPDGDADIADIADTICPPPSLLTGTMRVGSPALCSVSMPHADASDHGSRSITQSPSRRFYSRRKVKVN